MRVFTLGVAFFVLSAAAPPAFDPAAFERAIQASDYDKAASIIDKLIVERTPADGKPQQDSLVNALTGRVLLLSRQYGSAAVYLSRVDWSALPPGLRSRSLLAYGRALELQGMRQNALAIFRRAVEETTGDEDDHSSALLGVARQLVVSEPSEAAKLVAPLASAGNSRDRWQSLQIMAIAASLTGDSAGASRLAERSWNEAIHADADDLAPIKVAVTRAGLAAATGDRKQELAMLLAANSLGISKTSAISAQLPVCGDEGVRESDFVIFGIVTGPYSTKSLIPIAASRREIVSAFYDRLDGWDLINPASESSANGTVVTLSCRLTVSSDYVESAAPPDPLLDWFVEKGIYPAKVRFGTSDETINYISGRIDRLTARFGSGSPLLLEPQFQLANALAIRAVVGTDVSAARVIELKRKLETGLRVHGAPKWMSDALDLQNRLQLMGSSADSESTLQAFAEKQLRLLPFAMSRSLVNAYLSNVRGQLPTFLAQIIVDVDSAMPSTIAFRERQAWLLTLARAQRSLGHTAEIRKIVEDGRFEPQLCDIAGHPPEMLKNDFNYDDYPSDLILAEQQGFVAFESEVTSDGELKKPRRIVSLPSGLFDEATKTGLTKVRYSAAKNKGQESLCRGLVQGVIWRLQSPNFELPPLIPTNQSIRT